MKLSIEPVLDAFPGYRAAVVIARDLTIPEVSPPAWDAEMERIEEDARARWAGYELSQIPGIADWRAAYKAFGIKRTSYRSSVERLLKNILAGRPLPRVNGLVDAYNAISAEYVVPSGADDLDRVAGDLAFRPARAGDSYVRLGDETGTEDPPRPGEIVYADDEKVLCRRWNWSQDARSAITARTRRAVITFQSLGAAPPEPAAEALCAAVAEHCGGRADHRIVDRATPTAVLD